MTGTPEVPDWLQQLDAALAEPDRLERAVGERPGRGGRAAAVLALVGWGADGPEILFVERATTLRTHAGQIAFPGGAADPGDVDLADTALREAAEETGVQRDGVVVLGSLPPTHVAVSGFDVTAVVGWWRRPGALGPLDPREVASAELISVAELTDPDHRGQVRHPSGYVGPAFRAAGHLIWGLTAHFVDAILDLAGWTVPWDTDRYWAIPVRYLTDRSTTGGPDAH